MAIKDMSPMKKAEKLSISMYSLKPPMVTAIAAESNSPLIPKIPRSNRAWGLLNMVA